MTENCQTTPSIPDGLPFPSAILSLMKKAVQLHRSERTKEARRIYQQILIAFPEHPDALHLLGVAENEARNYETSVSLISAAIQSMPGQAPFYSNLGNAFRGLGRMQKAIACYQKSLDIDPEFHTAVYNLAVTYKQTRQVDKAEASARKALVLNPKCGQTWCLLGDILRQSTRIDESVMCFKNALAINPDFEQAWFYVGNAHRIRKETSKAVYCYERALGINPNFAECLNNLGLIFFQAGKYSRAVECYDRSIRYEQDSAEAHYNLGKVLLAIGREARALACYQKALEIRPDFLEATVAIGNLHYIAGNYQRSFQWFDQALALKPLSHEILEALGNTLRFLGDLNGAFAYFRRALEVKPDAHKVFISIGNTHRTLKNMDQAISSYRKALEYDPGSIPALNNLAIALADAGYTEAAILAFDGMLAIQDDFSTRVKRAMTLPIIYPSTHSMLAVRKCFAGRLKQLEDLGGRVKDPYREIGMVNFILALHGVNERPIREMIAAFYLTICPDLNWTTPHLKIKRNSKRIKLGIVCRYLHDHTIGRLYKGLIEKLDKQKFKIVIFRFESQADAIASVIDQCAEKVELLPADIQKARERIGSHELDVLFYPEIGMDPLIYFLAFSRLAAVQVKRGFQITMGIPAIDYFISSDAAEPLNAQQYYSERLIRLKGTGYYYRRPNKPAQLLDRTSFGLPEDRTLYVCTQSMFKLHPDFDPVLAAVLEADPNGVLVLLEGLHPQWKSLLLQRIEKIIPGAHDRIRFVTRQPRKAFMNLHLLADAVLDTIHFSGGHTSLECFAWGVPVVTWPSSMLPGRLTYGFYKQMGVLDCVAWDRSSYVSIAHRLANDLAWRQAVRRKILEKSTILFENINDVVELESFFETAVDAVYS